MSRSPSRPVQVPEATPNAGVRRVWRAAATLVGVAVAIFVSGTVLGLAVVGRHGGGPIQVWDDHVEAWMITHRVGLAGVSKVVAFLGDAPKLAALAVVATAVLLVRTRAVRGLVPLVAYLGAEMQVFLLRLVIHRHRPPTANYPAPHAVPGVHETSWSYPSGHAVAVTAVIFALLGLLAVTRGWSWPWVAAFVASLFVAFTRLVLGVHWFSDVTFGLLFGVAWGTTVTLILGSLRWADLRAALRCPHGPVPNRSTR